MWAPLILVLLAIVAYLLAGDSGGGGNDVQLSAAQIAGYASNVGFSGNDLVFAVAIALAESGGRTGVQGDLTLAPTNGPSIGLWQINTGSHAHPELAGQDLTDPQVNANAAYAIYKSAGYSFAPWSTFGNGAYTKYLQQAVAAAGLPECTSCCGVCNG